MPSIGMMDELVNPPIRKAKIVIGTISAKIIRRFLAFFICMRYVKVIWSTNSERTYPIMKTDE